MQFTVVVILQTVTVARANASVVYSIYKTQPALYITVYAKLYLHYVTVYTKLYVNLHT